jgi:hypothetical protein
MRETRGLEPREGCRSVWETCCVKEPETTGGCRSIIRGIADRERVVRRGGRRGFECKDGVVLEYRREKVGETWRSRTSREAYRIRQLGFNVSTAVKHHITTETGDSWRKDGEDVQAA